MYIHFHHLRVERVHIVVCCVCKKIVGISGTFPTHINQYSRDFKQWLLLLFDLFTLAK